MNYHRNENEHIIIDRNVAELAVIAGSYCKDAAKELGVALERAEYEDPQELIAQEIETAENSLRSALRFIEDAKRKLHA